MVRKTGRYESCLITFGYNNISSGILIFGPPMDCEFHWLSDIEVGQPKTFQITSFNDLSLGWIFSVEDKN